jgi:ATP synthase protein I
VTADPALALLRGGLVPALATGGVLVIVAGFAEGRAMAGAALGTAVVCVVMSAGPLVMRGTRRWSPPAVMAVSLITYGAVVLLLGVAYIVLERATWVSASHFGIALIVGCLAWTVGAWRAVWRVRLLAFGDVVTVSGEAEAGVGEAEAGVGEAEAGVGEAEAGVGGAPGGADGRGGAAGQRGEPSPG